MKVTVYFGNVRVIVPCGNGDILVRDLMDLAITRYKKATGKSPSSIVTVHNLKSSRDDGILYPEDQLNDVVDDREQIIAVFDENYSPSPQYICGDINSTSSVCTGSPDLFSVEVGSHCSIPYNHSDAENSEDPHNSGVTTLQVRRGSEPALNCLFPSIANDPSKRWSTAVVINTNSSEKQEANISEDENPSAQESLENPENSKMSPVNFYRGSCRLSILGNNSETYRWVEAADRQLLKDFNENFTLKPTAVNNGEPDPGSDTSSISDEREKTLILKNESGPLGIHVVPDYDSTGRDTGLVIQGIEAGGRIDRDGRFYVGDRITEINGKVLQNVSFQTAQEIFKNALRAPQIKLELVRGSNHSRSKTAATPRKPPPPVYPKPNIAETPVKSEEEVALVEGEERAGGVSTKVATVTPTKKVPASATRRLASANTRRIGKMLTIELTKGNTGLGFSITTRDNPAGGNSPIYIKNVLPKGAAIEDGRLQPGDRLLEVNGIQMSGKTQAEAVAILRNTPLGGNVQLVVSRQELEEGSSEQENNNELPTPIKLDDETGIFPWKHREILPFQISLNESAAGLGVSVKGKSTTTNAISVDLGIFVKSVIPGGAAAKDGRLQTNDQLVNINGISLLGMNNSNAMETLRKAMIQTNVPKRYTVVLTVARRVLHPTENENDSCCPSLKSEVLYNGKSSSGANSIDDLRDGIDYQNNIIQKPDKMKGFPESDASQSITLPGCNPVIERLTGQTSFERPKSLLEDPYGYSLKDKMHHMFPSEGDERKKSVYSSTINAMQGESVIIEGEYNHSVAKQENVQSHLNCNGAGESNVAPAASQISLDESNPGFARDGFGRQSMSEKRHAQLDAKSTDTYQRNKKAREERDRHRQSFEQEYFDKSNASDSTSSKNNTMNELVGPSLGLRKSSSLESLQTMIQELNKDDEALKRALQSGSSRSSRSRGCNESFRAAVDRSYEAPVASTMETLEEESESGSSAGHILGRSAELIDIPQSMNSNGFQEDLLNMYCRNSKSSKKKSLLKGLGSVFKFGKNKKQPQDAKLKDDESAQDTESIHTQSSITKDTDRGADFPSLKENDLLKRQLPQIPREDASVSSLDSLPNRQERMQSLREQHQRMHQKRQGHYPLDMKEEYYENELKEKESKYVVPMESSHGRSHSNEIHKDSNSVKPPPFGEANQYSNYATYLEIQPQMNQRVHHEHGGRSSSKTKLLPTSHKETLPSNFFNYEGMKQLQRHPMSQGSDVGSNSLPRGTHVINDHVLAHPQGQMNKPYFVHEAHNHSNYGRMNMHHNFYPGTKIYSHIVPGSKV